ncbi:MAG: response regulator [Burkholderiales bacterium]
MDALDEKLRALPAKKILYIEDSPINRHLVTKILAKFPHFELRCAETGEEGLALLQDFEPNLLLLDLQLPGIGGREVLARLKGRAAFPVLIFSADTSPGHGEDRLDGATGYISKPLDIVKFKQALCDCI